MPYQTVIVEDNDSFFLLTTNSKRKLKFKIWSDDGMLELELKTSGKFRMKIRYQYTLISSDPNDEKDDVLLDRWIIQEQTLYIDDQISIPICWNWTKGYFGNDEEENDDEDYDGLEGVVREIEIMELVEI